MLIIIIVLSILTVIFGYQAHKHFYSIWELFTIIALIKDKIKMNTWLKNSKYWNKTILGDTITDKVEKLTPIK